MINKAVNIFRSIAVIFFATVQFLDRCKCTCMLLGILLIVVNVSDTQQTWNQRVAPSWIGLDAKSLAAAFLTTSAPPIQRHRSVVGGCRAA